MQPNEESQTILQMVAAMAGDAGSLGSVLERYRVRLAGVVIAAGAYRHVEDVVQEAMLKIVQAVRNGQVQLRSVAEFRAWAHTVARNCARDQLRRQAHHPHRLSSVFGGAADSAGGAADRIAGSEATPSGHARSREELAALRRLYEARCDAITELRRPDQMLVWMRERDGLTFQAIAAEFASLLGVTVSQDALRVRYARLCQDRIGPALPEPPPCDDGDPVA